MGAHDELHAVVLRDGQVHDVHHVDALQGDELVVHAHHGDLHVVILHDARPQDSRTIQVNRRRARHELQAQSEDVQGVALIHDGFHGPHRGMLHVRMPVATHGQAQLSLPLLS